jgi:YD repeat-containing protein
MKFSCKIHIMIAIMLITFGAFSFGDTSPYNKLSGTLNVANMYVTYGQPGPMSFIDNLTTYGEYVSESIGLVYTLFPFEYLGQSTIYISGCRGDERTDSSQTITHGMINRIYLYDCNFKAVGHNGGEPIDYSGNLSVVYHHVASELYCVPPEGLYNGRCVLPCMCKDQRDQATGGCYPMMQLPKWESDEEAGISYPYPENNHGVPRCKVGSVEVEPIESLTCPASANSTQTDRPIDCATGQKKYVQVDYQGYGLDALTLERTYETKPKLNGVLAEGTGWLFQFPRLTLLDRIQTTLFGLSEVYRLDIGDRYSRTFLMEPTSATNSDYTSSVNGDGLVKPIIINRHSGNFDFQLHDGQIFFFDNQLNPTRILKPSGQAQVYYYYDAHKRLMRLENEFGRTLNFSYDGAGNVISVIDQDGVEVIYQYDNNNLKKVIYPDNTPLDLNDNHFNEYIFEQSSLPGFITGIVNEDGTRLANIHYDEYARAITSELSDGIERTEVSYPEEGKSVVKFYRDTAANAYREEVYSYGKYLGQYKLTSKAIVHCEYCALTTETWAYNSRELLTEHTSPAGIVTQYLYDTQDRRISITVGAGSAEATTTAYSWNDTYNKIEVITSATGETVFTFDTDGKLINTLITPVQ